MKVILLIMMLFLVGCGGCGSRSKMVVGEKMEVVTAPEPVIIPQDTVAYLDMPKEVPLEMLEGVNEEELSGVGGGGSGIGLGIGSVATMGRGRVLVPMAGEEVSEEPREASMEDLKKQLTPGVLAYDIPPEMKMGNKYRITLRVGDTVTQALSEGLSEHVSMERIEVSMTMKAVLTGKNFEIDTTLSSTVQLRKFNSPTIWEWDVIPKSSGKQKLRLKVICVLKRQGYSDDNFDLPVFEVERDISVNLGYIIKKLFTQNWESIVGAVGGSGVIGWMISFFRKKKKKKSEQAKQK